MFKNNPLSWDKDSRTLPSQSFSTSLNKVEKIPIFLPPALLQGSNFRDCPLDKVDMTQDTTSFDRSIFLFSQVQIISLTHWCFWRFAILLKSNHSLKHFSWCWQIPLEMIFFRRSSWVDKWTIHQFHDVMTKQIETLLLSIWKVQYKKLINKDVY